MHTTLRLTRSVSVVLCGAFFFGIGSARGQWREIDDWENGFADESNIDGQNGWTAPGGHEIIVDPTNPNNKVLHVTGANTNAWKDAVIPHGTIGSAFFRMYVPSGNEANADFEFDLTRRNFDTASPGGTEFRYHGDGTGNNIEVWDGSFQPTNIHFAEETWYDVWIVANNNTNSWQGYVQGGAYTTQTQVSHSGTVTEFAIRHGDPTDDLLVAYVKGNNAAANDHAYFDDIFFDPNGANLSVPPVIPEPASGALLAIAGLLILGNTARSWFRIRSAAV